MNKLLIPVVREIFLMQKDGDQRPFETSSSSSHRTSASDEFLAVNNSTTELAYEAFSTPTTFSPAISTFRVPTFQKANSNRRRSQLPDNINPVVSSEVPISAISTDTLLTKTDSPTNRHSFAPESGTIMTSDPAAALSTTDKVVADRLRLWQRRVLLTGLLSYTG